MLLRALTKYGKDGLSSEMTACTSFLHFVRGARSARSVSETARSKPSEQRELQASLRAMQIDDCELWIQMLAKR